VLIVVGWGPTLLRSPVDDFVYRFPFILLLKTFSMIRVQWGDGTIKTGDSRSQSKSATRPQECTTEQPRDIPMSSDPAFIYNHNPVFCGIESLRCAISIETASSAYANITSSFVCMSRLYNVTHQLGFLKGHWHSLERAMNAHIGNPLLTFFQL
jgi:hypothetical protein